VSTKVPCTAAAAGAPWTSFMSAVDEVLVRRAGIPDISGISGYIWNIWIYLDAARYPGISRIRFSRTDNSLALAPLAPTS